MLVEAPFVSLSLLICEPTRARMLWTLLDGKAYTATELMAFTDSSATGVSNHLAKLRKADLVKVEKQGRHRYYSFAKPEVAYAIEALASLAGEPATQQAGKNPKTSGIRFCRTCYDHLAGFVGVALTEALEQQGCLIKADADYTITDKGWYWLADLDINLSDLAQRRRPLTRRCLDWSERRPHLAGQLGATLLEKMVHQGWFRRVQSSRELLLTSKGRQELWERLRVTVD